MKNIKLVIFDMDGVLVDSECAITLAAMQALAEYGVEAKYDDFKQYTGMGDDKFVGGVAKKYGLEYKVDMKNRAYKIYIDTAFERVHVFPWSRKIIEKLHEMGYKLAVASASDHIKVERNIECIGVDIGIFDAVITGSDVKNKKPDPEIFLKAAQSVNIAPQNAVVFEDAISGVMAAKAAGAFCIAVTTSFTDSELMAAGADSVVDDLSEAVFIISE